MNKTASKYTRVLRFGWLPVGTRCLYRRRLHRKIADEKSISGVRQTDNAVTLFDSPQYRTFIGPNSLVMVTDEVADAVLKQRISTVFGRLAPVCF